MLILPIEILGSREAWIGWDCGNADDVHPRITRLSFFFIEKLLKTDHVARESKFCGAIRSNRRIQQATSHCTVLTVACQWTLKHRRAQIMDSETSVCSSLTTDNCSLGVLVCWFDTTEVRNEWRPVCSVSVLCLKEEHREMTRRTMGNLFYLYQLRFAQIIVPLLLNGSLRAWCFRDQLGSRFRWSHSHREGSFYLEVLYSSRWYQCSARSSRWYGGIINTGRTIMLENVQSEEDALRYYWYEDDLTALIYGSWW